jgi:fumarylpyruvate hydrolase
MTDLIFPAPEPATLAITGQTAQFPVRRIFCVGRNYAEHAREMGSEVDREAPFYFTKSPATLTASGRMVPYAPGTADLHHEIELVVALGAPAFRVTEAKAIGVVWGYAAGLDMTRRDLQAAAKDMRRPWDIGKDFDHSAIVAPLTPAAVFGAPGDQGIALSVNGAERQKARLSDMVWTVPALISHLSMLYHLAPGDLIFTGTPAGVGPVLPGDRIQGRIDGLAPVTLAVGPAE